MERMVINCGVEYERSYIPKVKIETIVAYASLNIAIAAIRCRALTGHVAVGKIFVSDVSYIVRMRTGDIDEAPL
jgi:nitrogen regulatory protein PII